MQEKSARVVQLEAACSDLAAENKELRGEAAASSREIESMRKRTSAAGGGGGGGGDNGDGAVAIRKAQVSFDVMRRGGGEQRIVQSCLSSSTLRRCAGSRPSVRYTP